MKTNQFVKILSCDKAKDFKEIETDNNRFLLIGSFLREYANLLSRLSLQHEGELDSIILEELNNQASKAFEVMLSQYQIQWFGQEWQMQERKTLDRMLFQRFQNFMDQFLKGSYLVNANMSIYFPYPEAYQGESVDLEDNVHLVIKKHGYYYGMVFHVGSAKKSMHGQSYATCINCDLQNVVVKQCLEKKYPRIIVTPVYLGTGEVKGSIGKWCVEPEGTLKSNVFFLDYADCYDEEGNFDADICMSLAMAGIRSMKKQSCESCFYRQYCNLQTVSKRRMEHIGETVWKVPIFDESQQEVVAFEKGAMLCCAGPGSGKTATLIGRVLQLGKKVPTEQMLVITFADQAAGELRRRLEGLLSEDEMPRICTLNAFGMEIIKLHDRINNTFHNLLTDSEKQRIVKEILEKRNASLTGISTKQFTGSKFSTVSIVTRMLDEYMHEPEAFFGKHKDYVESEWYYFSEAYMDIISEFHYISFDEQISLACEYMENDQDISDYIHSMYHYIMVDEYQDINDMQNRLISLTAAEGNIVCIGDDTQAIYSFRGGTAKYMKEFEHNYPGACIKWLSNNYRSTKNIVRICNEIREGAAASDYIEKEISESPNMIDGEVVTLMGNNDISSLNRAVEDALKHGYHYGDIAIIATQHKYLKKILSEISYPAEMADAYLIYDFCFNVVLNTLGIVLNAAPIMENAYRTLGYLFEMPESWFQAIPSIVKGESTLPKDDRVAELLTFAASINTALPVQYTARICAYLDMDETVSCETVCNLAYQTGVGTLGEYYLMLNDMVEFNAENKIEYPSTDKIILTTAHGSKGKEYPVVIVYDVDTYEGHVAKTVADGSFDRNLLYVATSRAKRELYMLKKAGTTCILDNSHLLKKL